MSQRPDRRVPDRDVVAVLAVVVLGVVGANVFAASVPGLDALLAGAPIVVIALVMVTGLILVRALSRRSGTR